ncbi:cilia- and flagella-associated protein 300-like [Prorops nasuta]|uniref:cilia- and flagella-associated protein 300-like n=1 Tax=Prorops nasuta TaxID=863751 RepID=UPI0034CEC68F
MVDLNTSFTFVPLENRILPSFTETETQNLLEKWGLKGNIIIQDFSFNEKFHPYVGYQFAKAFFRDKAVSKELLTKQNNTWLKQDITANSVEIIRLSCAVSSMSFFDKLKDPKNNIVYESGAIRKRYECDIDGIIVSDNLKGMLLDEECDEYGLYLDYEREEFIFRIFKLLVIGGMLCQYEDTLEPYLKLTKRIYKDLVRPQLKNDMLEMGTIVLEVIAKDYNMQPYFPCSIDNIQNKAFLLIDGNSHKVTTLLHQSGYCHM